METIYIKNMVCDRCIRTVQKIFDNHGIVQIRTSLGQVEIKNPLLPIELTQIKDALLAEGFELVVGSTPILVTKIKAALITLFGQKEISENFKLSTFLDRKISI